MQQPGIDTTTVQPGTSPPVVDENGFLINPELWDREIAVQLAHSELISELNDKHWLAIELVRKHFKQVGAPPIMRNVCRQLDLSPVDAHKLFSSCLQLWRVAGLPDPGEEARAHVR